MVNKLKNRIIKTSLLTGLLLLDILYNLVLLIFIPILWFGIFLWNDEKFTKIHDSWFDNMFLKETIIHF